MDAEKEPVHLYPSAIASQGGAASIYPVEEVQGGYTGINFLTVKSTQSTGVSFSYVDISLLALILWFYADSGTVDPHSSSYYDLLSSFLALKTRWRSGVSKKKSVPQRGGGDYY